MHGTICHEEYAVEVTFINVSKMFLSPRFNAISVKTFNSDNYFDGIHKFGVWTKLMNVLLNFRIAARSSRY